MVRKTYMAKYKNRFQTKVLVDNKPVLVDFKNASRNNSFIKGIFTTNNPDLIEALEKCGGFNKDFVLHNTVDDSSEKVDRLEIRSTEVNPPEEPEEVKKEVKPKAEAKVQPKEEPVIEPVKEEITEVKKEESVQGEIFVSKEEVSTVQGAKEYLKANYPELTARQLVNKKLVLEVAKEKNVRFEAITE